MYSEETKCIEVKFYPFSCNQKYYGTNSIRKWVRIIHNFCVFFCRPTFLSNLRLMRSLSNHSTSEEAAFWQVRFEMLRQLSCLQWSNDFMRNATHSNQTECGTEILYCVPSVPVRLPPSITMVTIVVVFSYPVVDFCCLGHDPVSRNRYIGSWSHSPDKRLSSSRCCTGAGFSFVGFSLFVTMKSGGKCP